MTEVSFVCGRVPFEYVRALSIRIGDKVRATLNSNDDPVSVTIEPRGSGLTFTAVYTLRDGQTYTAPPQTTAADSIEIDSPFRREQVGVYVIWEKDGWELYKFEVTARHVHGDIRQTHSWQGQRGNLEPWTLYTTAPDTLFKVNYSGWIERRGEGMLRKIPGTWLALAVIDIDPTSFSFTVKIDPTAVRWQRGYLDEVVTTVYQKNAAGQMIQPVSTKFVAGDGVVYLPPYRAEIKTGIEYYWTAEYWVTGGRKVTCPERQMTTQIVRLPATPPA